MEAEMAEARRDMEVQIRNFQQEVDRRMDLQAERVHAIVEERVQQQLDAILHAEMEKVRTMVEDHVQGPRPQLWFLVPLRSACSGGNLEWVRFSDGAAVPH
jgi:hypothetical protein